MKPSSWRQQWSGMQQQARVGRSEAWGGNKAAASTGGNNNIPRDSLVMLVQTCSSSTTACGELGVFFSIASSVEERVEGVPSYNPSLFGVVEGSLRADKPKGQPRKAPTV